MSTPSQNWTQASGLYLPTGAVSHGRQSVAGGLIRGAGKAMTVIQANTHSHAQDDQGIPPIAQAGPVMEVPKKNPGF